MVSQAAPQQPRRGKALRTREGLVAAVADEIAATGSFTAERVALRAGTSPATFYAHLPSKDLALAAAFDRVLGRLDALIEEALRIERLLDDGLARVAADFVRAGVAFFSRESRLFRLAMARFPESDAVREVHREHTRRAFAHYRRFLELGHAAGKIRGDDPETLARAMMVVTQGLNNPIALHREEDDGLLDELARVLVALLAPDPDAAPEVTP